MNRATFILTGISFILLYLLIGQYQSKKNTEKKVNELFAEIKQIQQDIIENNQIISDNEQKKIKLENQSLEQQDRINEQLKNNNCANELVPKSVSDSLYNRAKNIRQPNDTRKFTQ